MGQEPPGCVGTGCKITGIDGQVLPPVGQYMGFVEQEHVAREQPTEAADR